jgi:hypothetical protein
LIIGWFSITAIGNLPLLLNNAFGEDPGGFCGARKFTEVKMLLLYEMSTMSIFFVSLVLSGLYYMRLAKWLKQHEDSTNAEGINFTREIMMVTKIITLIPVVLASPGVMLTAGQMILPVGITFFCVCRLFLIIL